ncbi:MAG: hypothetical protein ACXWDI_00145 [Nocardioides sp.]
MSDVENARARAEAMNEPVNRSLQSARRAQLWAGLNRYLASEAAHAKRTEDVEEEETEAKAEGPKLPEQKAPPRTQDRE